MRLLQGIVGGHHGGNDAVRESVSCWLEAELVVWLTAVLEDAEGHDGLIHFMWLRQMAGDGDELDED